MCDHHQQSASNQILWRIRKILGPSLDPAVFVVSGVAEKKIKTHNENNHVQKSEKQNATSVIIINIKSDMKIIMF